MPYESRTSWIAAGIALALAAGMLSCSSSPSAPEQADRAEVVASTSAALATPPKLWNPIRWSNARYNWLQFGGDSAHSGNNQNETRITPQNVSQLAPLYTVPYVTGGPVVLTDVNFNGTLHDVAYFTTVAPPAGMPGPPAGLLGVDAYTGATLVSPAQGSAPIQLASPAIDPSTHYIYYAAADRCIHRFYPTGGEVDPTACTPSAAFTQWPATFTMNTTVSISTSSLTISTPTSGGTYLYAATRHCGDSYSCQGELTTLNLGTNAQNVFNMACSNSSTHVVCPTHGAGIWGRAGVTFDPLTQKLFAMTGDGPSAPPTVWSQSIVALNPDGSGAPGWPANGLPVDSYTAPFGSNSDVDLGSANLVILPNNGSNFPHLAFSAGKDSVMRLINLDNLSNSAHAGPDQGGPGKPDGSIITPVAYPHGGTVLGPMATWVNPADNTTWVFFNSRTDQNWGIQPSGSAINGVQLQVVNGVPSLPKTADGVTLWTATTPNNGGGLLVANGVLYSSDGASLVAHNPTTGAILWTSPSKIGLTTGYLTPVVANGILYYNGSAFSLTTPPVGRGTNQPNLIPASYDAKLCYTTEMSLFAGDEIALSWDGNRNWELGAWGNAPSGKSQITANCVNWTDLVSPYTGAGLANSWNTGGTDGNDPPSPIAVNGDTPTNMCMFWGLQGSFSTTQTSDVLLSGTNWVYDDPMGFWWFNKTPNAFVGCVNVGLKNITPPITSAASRAKAFQWTYTGTALGQSSAYDTGLTSSNAICYLDDWGDEEKTTAGLPAGPDEAAVAVADGSSNFRAENGFPIAAGHWVVYGNGGALWVTAWCQPAPL
jgi:hypothetical protein